MSDPGMELAKEGVRTAVSEAMKPVTGIVGDVLGGLIGDPIHNWRRNKPAWQERNQREMAEKAAKILQDRGVGHAAEYANPTYVEEVLELAKDTNSKELQDLFARLIAAAMDPDRILGYRREFAEVVKQMEPVDTLVLNEFLKLGKLSNDWRKVISETLGLSIDAVIVSAKNLLSLSLVVGKGDSYKLGLSEFGREFLKAVRD